MRAIAALLFFLSLCSLPVPGAADDLPAAADIRARAQAAVGPAPDNFRETIEASGSLGNTKTVTYRSGKDVRRTFDRGGFHTENGTYHGEAWRQNDNGLTVAIPPDPGAELKETMTTTVTRVSQPLDAYVITERNVRGAGTRLYFDPATYHLVREESFGANGTVVETNDDFVAFGQQTLPKHWTISSQDSQLEMHYERVERVAGAVSDADVAQTPTRRALVEFPAGTKQVDLPVTIVRNAVFVRLTIGSRSADFELDTGAGSIFVDTGFAKEIGLLLTNATSEVTARRYTAYNAMIPEIRIGPLSMHDIAVNVAPMPVGYSSGVKPVGLLGFDFLAQLGVTIDYQHESVRVVPAENFVAPTDPSTYNFAIRLGAGVPMLTVSVADAVADHVALDTGWSSSLAFFDYFTRRYPGAFSIDLGPIIANGVGGAIPAEQFRIHELRLGPLHFHDFVAMRLPPGSYAGTFDGVIGNGMLSLFTLTLDYTGGAVYLTPNATR